MIATIMKMALLSLITLLGVSCSKDNSIVDKFTYDVSEQNLDLDVTFSDKYELNTELQVPILNYGSIVLSHQQEVSLLFRLLNNTQFYLS